VTNLINRLTANYLNPTDETKEISLDLSRSFSRNKEFFKNWIFKLKEHVATTYDYRNPLTKLCYSV